MVDVRFLPLDDLGYWITGKDGWALRSGREMPVVFMRKVEVQEPRAAP